MEKRLFGKTNMSVTVLGFGGAEIGFENASQSDVTRLLMQALDEGLNVIDTAECYVNSEELIGKAISQRRQEFYLFTKCGHGDNFKDAWQTKDIERSIDRSLKRLQTDYLDLLQLHSCSADILRRGEVIEVLQCAKKEGKTRFIGYSGDGADAVYAIKSGVFDTLQTSINVADQEALELTIPLAREQNMGVIAKRPVANAVWRNKTQPENTYVQPYWERLQELKYDFLNGSHDRAIEIALRFTLSVLGVHTAIVGTKTPGRWRQNSELVNKGVLDKEQFEAIRSRWQSIASRNWIGQI